ncbi:hypothetical protein CHH28_07660 [Bacterioplanes sanyensis]|uniref:MAPEG family protein n=1 Tax=Bacterioplanes sanyensis TaxID=1249553 RepID=A0A222FHL3_9GAMM|nr:MAPEG family protein [Bacterioplanes sanyensis]ASP38557.1 hypothetical protein CHH28_07660 [Bacterioplanes sanyensis]
MPWLDPYQTTVLMLGLSGLLFFIQLMVADVVGILSGHTPGALVEQNHQRLLFRASRVIANSNESIGIFILFVLFGFLTSAAPEWMNRGAVVYFVGRLGHMGCYYLNLAIARSIAFAVSCVGLVILFAAGMYAWW